MPGQTPRGTARRPAANAILWNAASVWRGIVKRRPTRRVDPPVSARKPTVVHTK